MQWEAIKKSQNIIIIIVGIWDIGTQIRLKNIDDRWNLGRGAATYYSCHAAERSWTRAKGTISPILIKILKKHIPTYT